MELVFLVLFIIHLVFLDLLDQASLHVLEQWVVGVLLHDWVGIPTLSLVVQVCFALGGGSLVGDSVDLGL
jgi:hypothetical protein